MTAVTARKLAGVLYGGFLLVWLVLRVPLPADFPKDSGMGFQLAAGQQILAGEHPFVGFQTSYGPLAHYLSALGLSLAGGRVIGEWVLEIATNTIAFGGLGYLLWRTRSPLPVSLGLAVVATLSISRLWKYFVVLGPVLTLLAAWSYSSRPDRRRLVLLAASVALAGLLRQDLGIFSFLCASVAVAHAARRRGRAVGGALLELGAFVAAAASPYLLWAASIGGLGSYLVDSVRISLSISSGLALPFPAFNWKSPLFSPVNVLPWLYSFFFLQPVVGAALYAARRRGMDDAQRVRWLTTLTLSGLCLIQATHRSDLHHLLQAIPVTFVLMALIFKAMETKRAARVGRLVGLLLAFPTAWLLIAGAPRPRPDLEGHLNKMAIYAGSKDDFLAFYTERFQNSRVAAARDARRCTAPDERILALPFGSQIYFLSGRAAAAGLLVTAPGWYDSERDQRAALRKLQEDDPLLFVNMTRFAYDGRADRALPETHPLVWAYIERSFTPAKSYGDLDMALRRGLDPVRQRQVRSCLGASGEAGRPVPRSLSPAASLQLRVPLAP